MMLFVLQVSPQFDMHSQTPVEQWKKKPRRIKVSDILYNNPKSHVTGVREKRPLRVVQNLKFHGEETCHASLKCPVRMSTCHSQIGRISVADLESKGRVSADKLKKQVEPPLVEESFSSDLVFSSSQQRTMVDELSVFRPARASTPCAKKTLIQTTSTVAHTKPCNLYHMVPDPSPNVFRWCTCDDVFVSAEKHCSRDATNPQFGQSTNYHPQSKDVDQLQSSVEKLSFEHNPPCGDERDEKNVTADGDSLSVLACDTPIHDGEYVMPYSRVDIL